MSCMSFVLNNEILTVQDIGTTIQDIRVPNAPFLDIVVKIKSKGVFMDAIAQRMARLMVERNIVPKEQYGRAAYKATLFVTSMFTTLVIVLISLVTWTPQAALMYMLAYFSLHTCAPTVHFKRYLYCFSLSAGLYLAMTLSLLFVPQKYLLALAVMGLICCVSVILAGVLKSCGRTFPLRAQILKCGVAIAAIALLVFAPVGYAFPFVFGMLVINILQLKARNQNG